MATYNYDRENAEKAFEYMKYKRANYTLGKFSDKDLITLHSPPSLFDNLTLFND
jgi:hypothetical protein